MNDVVLRQAGPEDSAFAFHAQRAAFREYVEKADGWDEGASNSGSTPSGSAPRAIA